jgi:hypothetical protein
MSERIVEMAAEQFEPAKYLVNLNGRGEYLEVKWRLLWLRTEHPEASIETELVRLEDHDAVFKARVTIPGGGSATGYGPLRTRLASRADHRGGGAVADGP